MDDDILIDAGTGVGFLSLDEMSRIKHIFITHSHLDHIISVALLVDTLFDDLIDSDTNASKLRMFSSVGCAVRTLKMLTGWYFGAHGAPYYDTYFP